MPIIDRSKLEILCDDATCPDCGQKTATIALRKKEECEEIVIFFHDLCGFYQTLFDYINLILEKNSNTYNIIFEVPERSIKIFIDSRDSIPTSTTIKRIISNIGSYFTKFYVSQSGIPDSCLCPLCGGNEFVGKEEKLICKEGHFDILAKYFLKRFFIDNDFKVYMTDLTNESKFNINRIHSKRTGFWVFGDEEERHSPIANVTYRLNTNRKMVLIITRAAESQPLEYKDLLDRLNLHLSKLFIILEKV